MARSLRYLGMLALVICAWLAIAGEARWVSDELYAVWFPPLLKAGVAMFLGGLALSVLSPVGAALRGNHCVRCRRPIGKGQIYCADHLQDSINEARDEMHRTEARHRKAR